MSLFCLLSEHQAALLQLKRECKEELERMHVSYRTTLADVLKYGLKTHHTLEKIRPGIRHVGEGRLVKLKQLTLLNTRWH